MCVLFIEDDQKIASFVIKGLKETGFAVDHASDGEDGLHLALTEPYDALIVDIMLPKLDGLTIIEKLRIQNINTPVIILSAKRSVDDRVKGLHKGSDDYLTKPFAFSELLARLQALIRRSNGRSETTRLLVGDLSMDLLTREVSRGGQGIELQPREFALLEYLMQSDNTLPDEQYPGGAMLNNSPKYMVTSSYEHNFDLANGSCLTPRLDIRYQTEMLLEFIPESREVPEGMDVDKVNTEPAHFMIDFSTNYNSSSGKWNLNGYVKNILNHAEKTGFKLSELRIGSPRTYGAILSVKF